MKYAINERIEDVIPSFIKYLCQDKKGYSVYLLGDFLKAWPEAIELVKRKFELLPIEIKPSVLYSLLGIEECKQWESEQLSQEKDEIIKVNKTLYFKCKILLGDMAALRGMISELKNDIDYFGHGLPSPEFKGYGIEALPYFAELLDLSFSMRIYNNWTSRILDVMESMAVISDNNLSKVIKVLRTKAIGSKSWLNRIIEDIKYQYWEVVDEHLTVKDAAKKVLSLK